MIDKNEKPIIFKPLMIRAILNGNKTQTRRVMIPQPWNNDIIGSTIEGFQTTLNQAKNIWFNENKTGESIDIKWKYMVGDTLWVREKFCNGGSRTEPEYYYFADTLSCEYDDPEELTWKPSIHMPRVAARIFLKVTSVSIQKLQNISEEDAISEGIVHTCPVDCPPPCGGTDCTDYISAYRNLWDSINAKRGYPWERNPWVWVINFSRTKG